MKGSAVRPRQIRYTTKIRFVVTLSDIMKLVKPLSTPLQGIQDGMQRLQRHADTLATEGPSNVDAAVGLIEAEQQVKASAAALETEQSVQKRLIDLFV